MVNLTVPNKPPAGGGLVFHGATRYDWLLWLVTLGRETALREQILELAALEPGQSILDVGCGTGTLALAAKRRVGTTGRVYGIDASPEMLSRAYRKAARANTDVTFLKAFAQDLPFADGQFNTVLTTIMLHHLPRGSRRQCAREAGRVLKPGGRILAVDFGVSSLKHPSLLDHFRRPRHGSVELSELIALFSEEGLHCIQSGPVGIGSLQFVVAGHANH